MRPRIIASLCNLCAAQLWRVLLTPYPPTHHIVIMTVFLASVEGKLQGRTTIFSCFFFNCAKNLLRSAFRVITYVGKKRTGKKEKSCHVGTRSPQSGLEVSDPHCNIFTLTKDCIQVVLRMWPDLGKGGCLHPRAVSKVEVTDEPPQSSGEESSLVWKEEPGWFSRPLAIRA